MNKEYTLNDKDFKALSLIFNEFLKYKHECIDVMNPEVYENEPERFVRCHYEEELTLNLGEKLGIFNKEETNEFRECIKQCKQEYPEYYEKISKEFNQEFEEHEILKAKAFDLIKEVIKGVWETEEYLSIASSSIEYIKFFVEGNFIKMQKINEDFNGALYTTLDSTDYENLRKDHPNLDVEEFIILAGEEYGMYFDIPLDFSNTELIKKRILFNYNELDEMEY